MSPEIVEYSDERHRGGVIALWQSIFGYGEARNDPALAIDRKVAVDDGLFFVAEYAGEVAGTLMAGYDGHRGWIYSLAVDPEQRSHRLGSKLLEVAEAKLTALGCVKINLQVRTDNADVQRFYERDGYSVEPRISMGKSLMPERDRS